MKKLKLHKPANGSLRALAIIAVLTMLMPLSSQTVFAAGEAVSVVNLKTDGRVDPLGIDVTTPSFSWLMESNIIGARQASYHIVVKNSDGNTVWDTGMVNSSSSTGIRYNGRALEPATRYSWTVSVTDNNGNRITPSAATFETGLMSTAKWPGAQWIGGELTMNASMMRMFDYTVDMRIPAGSTKASVILFADEFRLKNNVFNTLRLESDVNYIRYEVDVTTPSAPVLNIYVVGYSADAVNPETTPNQTLPIPAEALPNVNDWFTMLIPNNGTCSINGVSIGAPANLPRIGSTISMLGKIGFAVPARGTAAYRNMRVFQTGSHAKRAVVFGPAVGATYSIFEAIPGVSISGNTITVAGGTAGVLQYADPTYGSEPMVRKEFMTQRGKTVKSARLYATSQGIFEAYFNGVHLGAEDWLKPGYNEYREHMPYMTFDVTGLLNGNGAANAIGAQLAEGWWNGYWAHSGFTNYYGDQPAFMAQLVINYTDGTSDRIVTDRSWTYTHEGPVEYASLLMGERYNAITAEAMKDWSKPGYVARETWKPANVIPTRIPFRNYEMITRYDIPVRVYDELTAREVWETKPGSGSYIYDIGENIAGVPQITIPAGYADEGDEIIIRMAEVLYPMATEKATQNALEQGWFNDNIAGLLMAENYRSALSTDFYIAKAGAQVYAPRFTQHAYRYLEITGLKRPLPKENVKTLVLTSVDITSTFDSSNPLSNRMFKNAQNSHSSNYISIPTDCPQRNERLGWLGDAQAFSVTAAYNADMYQFTRDFMRTLISEQAPSGDLPIYAPSYPPYNVNTGVITGLPGNQPGGNGSISWCGAVCLLPYNAYKQYGSTEIIEENIDAMIKYLNYLDEGDFYVGVDLGNGQYERRAEPALTSKNGGLADWLSRVNTNSPLINNALYGYLYRITAEMAEAVGRTELARELNQHYLDTKEAWNRVYIDSATGKTQTAASYNPETGVYTPSGIQDTQASYSTALRYDMVTDTRTIDHYLNTIRHTSQANINDGYPVYDYSITTGFSGTPNLVPVLSNYGYVEEAYKMYEQTEYASWLFPVTQGATSIWERWNGFTLENGFAGLNSMNSFNHFALGAISEWVMAYQLGITTDGVGYHDFVLQPMPGGTFTYANGSTESVYGRIYSGWTANDGKMATYSAVIPANTNATLYLPVASVGNFRNIPGVTFVKMTTRNNVPVAEFKLLAGAYDFTVNAGGVTAAVADGYVAAQ